MIPTVTIPDPPIAMRPRRAILCDVRAAPTEPWSEWRFLPFWGLEQRVGHLPRGSMFHCYGFGIYPNFPTNSDETEMRAEHARVERLRRNCQVEFVFGDTIYFIGPASEVVSNTRTAPRRCRGRDLLPHDPGALLPQIGSYCDLTLDVYPGDPPKRKKRPLERIGEPVVISELESFHVRLTPTERDVKISVPSPEMRCLLFGVYFQGITA